MSESQGRLNDEWFYDQLGNLPLNKELGPSDEPDLDLRPWCGSAIGVRWRSEPESFWVYTAPDQVWSKLLARVPKSFGDELVFLFTFLLEALRHIAPNMDTILANHAYMEWLLYHDLDKENYREHIVHPVKVAVVARWLLKESQALDNVRKNLKQADHVKTLLEHLTLAEDVFDRDNGGDKVIYAALWLAGLLHAWVTAITSSADWRAGSASSTASIRET